MDPVNVPAKFGYRTERCYKLPYSPKLIHIAAYDLYERTARCKFISRVDFLSRLELTCNETDGEHFDGDATTDRLDPTGKAQVDLIDPTRRSTPMECALTNTGHPLPLVKWTSPLLAQNMSVGKSRFWVGQKWGGKKWRSGAQKRQYL